MTSFRQFQANRQNAQKSTGPTTAEGKQIMYALDSVGRPKQHQRSRFAFLRARSPRQTEDLLIRVRSELAPKWVCFVKTLVTTKRLALEARRNRLTPPAASQAAQRPVEA